jgi:hypothetical protein
MNWAYVAIVIWAVVAIVGLALVAGGAGADAHLDRLDEQHHAGCDLRTKSSDDRRASIPAQLADDRPTADAEEAGVFVVVPAGND